MIMKMIHRPIENEMKNNKKENCEVLCIPQRSEMETHINERIIQREYYFEKAVNNSTIRSSQDKI